MQNRYTGDIGDYGKLGLLRVLQSTGLTIGINWYLTPDETHNGDGRHVDYLTVAGYRPCDEALWLELGRIVSSKQREVRALQKDQILKATFYSKPLDFFGMGKSERIETRIKWHKAALGSLSGIDVVFVDPDNGLVVPSAAGTRKENKYVTPDELAGYYMQGSSVIYYQHKARRQNSFYTDQHNRLIASSGFKDASGLGLLFRPTSQRYYFFIIQPAHFELVTDAVTKMLASAWGNCFYPL